MMTGWRSTFLALAALLQVVEPALAASRGETMAEYRIKAAFLYHFCNYVSWPEGAFADAGAALRIGVVGPRDITQQLQQQIGARRAHDRPMEVIAVAPDDDLGDLHVLYVVDPAALQYMDIPTDAALLVVTESAHGLASGSVINFVVEQDRVRFDIASDTARRRGLNISAQLFTVARHIRGDVGWHLDSRHWQFAGRLLDMPGASLLRWVQLLRESRPGSALLHSLHDVAMFETAPDMGTNVPIS